MQIFLSWSGERSKRTAAIISAWLKMVIQAIDPWMSPDIEKGKRWGIAIAERLDKSKAGIICLDKDNVNEKWILFEAGALSKSVKNSYVCVFLLDINREDIESPLADFQNTVFEKEDMRKLVHTLNSALSESKEKVLDEKVLDTAFDMFWPKIEEDLKAVISMKPKRSEPRRSEKEILVEILEIVRSMQRKNEEDDWVSQLAATKLDSPEQRKILNYAMARYLAGTAGVTKDSSCLNTDSIEVAKPRFLNESIRKKINKGD